MITGVLVGGKKREDVLALERLRLDDLTFNGTEGDLTHPANSPSNYPPMIPGDQTFWLENNSDHAIINGVPFGEDMYQVLLFKQPIKELFTQNLQVGFAQYDFEGWQTLNTNWINNTKSKVPYVVPSASFLASIFETAHRQYKQDKCCSEIDAWKEDFRKTLLTYPIWTCTQVGWNSDGVHVIDQVPEGKAEAFNSFAFKSIFETDSLDGTISWLTGKKALFGQAPDWSSYVRGVSFRSGEEGYILDASTPVTDKLYAIGAKIWQIDPTSGGSPP